MMKPIGAVLAAIVLLGGCEISIVGPPPAGPPPASCGAENLQGLIGHPVKDLKLHDTPERVRIYQTGQPLTLDYFPDRLNVEIDSAGRIRRLHCG